MTTTQTIGELIFSGGGPPDDNAGRGWADKGTLYVDRGTPGIYQNHGTRDDPDWRPIASPPFPSVTVPLPDIPPKKGTSHHA